MEPVDGSALRYLGVVSGEPKCRAYDFVDMLAQLTRCDGAKTLCSKILANTKEDCWIVKKGVLSTMQFSFGRGKSVVFEKVLLICTDLASMILIFSHTPCNCKARIQAWLCAGWILR